MPYLLGDMAAGAVGVLDHLGIDTAHVFGVSMGGMIVQTLAIEHPDRVATLTSVMSTTGDLDVGNPTGEAMALLMSPPARSREELQDAARGATLRQPRPVRRGRAAGHRRPGLGPWLQPGAPPVNWRRSWPGQPIAALAEVGLPALVIHGAADTLIHPSGGERRRGVIPDAKLVVIDGMGHDLPRPLWPQITDLLVDHARSNGDDKSTMGPLAGITVIEIAGIEPGPYCGMLLADMGADVIRVDRAQAVQGGDPARPPADLLARGRLGGRRPQEPRGRRGGGSSSSGPTPCSRASVRASAERLGIGPDECLATRNWACRRMTGWGQDGPYAAAAGHDINYISLAGASSPSAGAARPRCRRSTWWATSAAAACSSRSGIACGIVEAQRSGQGQVIDAAMVDGAASLMTMTHSFRAMGIWNDERGTNMLDTGAHYYDVYETADGKYVSIGSIEPQFYAELLRLTGLEGEELPGSRTAATGPS